MTLREVLDNKSQVCVKEYERWGDKLIFVGGCYYADNRIIPIDGGFYSLGMELNAWGWKNGNTLMIVR